MKNLSFSNRIEIVWWIKAYKYASIAKIYRQINYISILITTTTMTTTTMMMMTLMTRYKNNLLSKRVRQQRRKNRFSSKILTQFNRARLNQSHSIIKKCELWFGYFYRKSHMTTITTTNRVDFLRKHYYSTLSVQRKERIK